MLTDSNDGAKLRLLVLISSVDGDGAEENESENCEERERHGAEEVSTLPPRRATSRTRNRGGEGGVCWTCWRSGVSYLTPERPSQNSR